MNLSDVMDDLALALERVHGLRVSDHWPSAVAPPAVMVGWPDDIVYDATMGRGGDRCEFPVTLVVGKADARSARAELARYLNGSGPWSVKQAVDTYAARAYASARVIRAQVEIVPIAAVDFLGATFRVDIIGTGE